MRFLGTRDVKKRQVEVVTPNIKYSIITQPQVRRYPFVSLGFFILFKHTQLETLVVNGLGLLRTSCSFPLQQEAVPWLG